MPATSTIRPVGATWRWSDAPVTPLALTPKPAVTPAVTADRLTLTAAPKAREVAPDPSLPGGRLARVVVSIRDHRAYLFDKDGELEASYRVRTGKDGSPTRPGVKIVVGKNRNPTDVAERLWPSSGGRAFGTRLIDLSDFDPQTGRTYRGKYGGQELHGTYDKASIGRNFSHGCVGLINKDIEAIFDAVAVGDLVRFDA